MVKLEIITPEQVCFRYETAGLISRALAWLIDQLYLWLGYLLLAVTLNGLGRNVGAALAILAIFVLEFSYFVGFELSRGGQSPGKRAMGLRVMSVEGTRVSFADVLIRNLLRPVDFLPWGMLLGAIIAMTDTSRRRLGDIAAGTVVVRDLKRSVPEVFRREKARFNTFQSDRVLQKRIQTRMTRAEREWVVDLTLRRDELQQTTREELFADAAVYFRRRFGLPENLEHLSDEQTVIGIALVAQDASLSG